jgi:hypothetical protein
MPMRVELKISYGPTCPVKKTPDTRADDRESCRTDTHVAIFYGPKCSNSKDMSNSEAHSSHLSDFFDSSYNEPYLFGRVTIRP